MSRRDFGNITTVPGMVTRIPFGKTRNFITNMSIENLLNSLSMKALPDELQELYKDVQRVTTATRVDAFEDYCALHMLNEKDVAGYIPAITVSLMSTVELQEGNDGLDVLKFKPTEAFAVDGLGRLNTFMRMLGSYPTNIRGKTKENKARIERRFQVRQLLSNLEISVIFVLAAKGEEIESRDIGQVFADVNFKQQKVKPIQAMRLDASDPVIQWARELAKIPQLVSQGGMSEESTRITINSSHVVTLNTMVRFCQGALGGQKMQSKSTGARQLSDGTEVNNKYIKSFKPLVTLFLSTWLDTLGSKMSQDKTGYQVNSSAVQSLGLVFYAIYNSNSSNEEKLKHALIDGATRIGKLDYSRFAKHWERCDVMEMREKGYASSAGGGRTFREGIGRYVCSKLGLGVL